MLKVLSSEKSKTMRLTSKLALMAVALIGLGLSSCGKEDDNNGGGGSGLSDLQIFFGADEYTAQAGETVTIPFSISGVEGKTLTLTPSADIEGCTFKVNNDANYQGTIKVTTPDVLTANTNINVTLKAEDKANKRETSASVPVKTSASENLSIKIIGDMTSIAVQGATKTDIQFTVGGASAESVTFATPEVTVSTGWTASVTMSTKTTGVATITSQGTPSGSVTVSLSVTDNYKRTASDSRSYTIVEITTAAGAANSFIVKPGSTQTILAVKGSSTEKVDFDYAKLLWQDAKGMVKSVGGNVSAGLIAVELNSGIEGNAVVAAVKNEEIVWSWHLWVTNYDPLAVPLIWKNAKSQITYTMMDRNLGARTNIAGDEKCYGLYYQWGRKDPFVGPDGLESSVPMTRYDIQGNALEERVIKLDYSIQQTSDNNLATSIANPDAYMYYSPEPAAVFLDWYCFSDAAQNNDLWGYKTGFKSNYDPCPEGWRVAPSEAFTFRNLYKKAGSLTNDGAYDSSQPWYWDDVNEGGTDAGFYYRDTVTKVKYFFPLNGKRDMRGGGSLTSVAGGGNLWNYEPSQKYALCEMLAFGNPASITGLNRAYGFGIRCTYEGKK